MEVGIVAGAAAGLIVNAGGVYELIDAPLGLSRTLTFFSVGSGSTVAGRAFEVVLGLA